MWGVPTQFPPPGALLAAAPGLPPTHPHITRPQISTTGISTTGIVDDAEVEEANVDILRCHLHTKPQLTCKFCRKYKSSVHQQARIAQQQAKLQPQEESRFTVEITNTSTYNMNNLLRDNILSSEYFKSLYALKTYHEVIDEIYSYTEHAEPYVAGNTRAPSTLFCCLYKFFTMRLTERQVLGLLEHMDSPYIRCAGFLYLRYVHPPDKLWKWFENYFLDDEEFTPGADKLRTTTIGEYIESLITEDKYYATVLPRLPVKIKTLYGAQLIAMKEHRARKASNKKQANLFSPGREVVACSNGDWLEGEVIELTEPHPGRTSCLIKLEDDTEEEIDLGLVILRPDYDDELDEPDRASSRRTRKKDEKERERNRDREGSARDKTSRRDERGHRESRPSRSRSRSRVDRNRDRRSERKSSPSRAEADYSSRDSRASQRAPMTQAELLMAYRKKESAKALASGKDYARRPTSYKSSLSLRQDAGVSRKRIPSPPPRIRPIIMTHVSSEPVKETHEPSHEHRQKMAQLMERYTKREGPSGRASRGEVEGPEVLRLG